MTKLYSVMGRCGRCDVFCTEFPKLGVGLCCYSLSDLVLAIGVGGQGTVAAPMIDRCSSWDAINWFIGL